MMTIQKYSTYNKTCRFESRRLGYRIITSRKELGTTDSSIPGILNTVFIMFGTVVTDLLFCLD